MPDWSKHELLQGTIWCETSVESVEIWLEWNEYVFAYRFGIVKNGKPSKSSLGFADSLEDAQNLALEELENILK
jgi:hypothetical protein